MAFKTPPLTTTENGQVRCVGYEIEFTGLTIGNVTKILKSVFGGQLEKKSSVEYVLHTSENGKFKVELDWEFLKNKALDAKINHEGQEWVDFLHKVASSIVPLEVVSPPFPFDQLHELDQLIPALRDAGAKGTDDSVAAAFGVHVNPELPALDVETIHAYLKAFGLLQWWLNDAHDVNLARKVSPYIQLYSEEYVTRLLNEKYQNINELIDDYLTHNPSRNRALDMLPLFAFINEQQVKAVITDSKVNQRPTFHYRLPDCLVEDSHWSFATSWNIWYWVEVLANDVDSMKFLTSRFLDLQLPLIGVQRNEWIKEINQWVKNQELG